MTQDSAGINLDRRESGHLKLEHSYTERGRALKGFLGTQAGFAADLNLLLQVAMGAALILGAFLARRKRYTAHGACQAAVLLLNLGLISSVMWPALYLQVWPGLPKHFARRYYAIAALHGISGAVAELLGLYILLVAGTDLIPQTWRFRRWKLWMRVELGLWLIVLLTGIGTYFIWYTRDF
jgi:uncharacterized membrane protein YozB (DUF420 family)